MRSTKVLGLLVALGVLAGCGAGQDDAEPVAGPTATKIAGRTVSAASLTAGQAVPKPSGTAVLTVTGRITHANRDGAVAFDLATIERVGVQQIRLYEPWVKQTLEFRGVPLADLLAVAGAAPEATRLRITAHDDYSVDVALADVRAGGVLLATRSADGAPLAVDNGGPTRVVYADGVAAGANPDQWIWSLKSIDVA